MAAKLGESNLQILLPKSETNHIRFQIITNTAVSGKIKEQSCHVPSTLPPEKKPPGIH